jgi:hypothetical protein
MFLDYFDVLMSKINLKNKNIYYFNIFFKKNILKNKHDYLLVLPFYRAPFYQQSFLRNITVPPHQLHQILKLSRVII